MSEPRDYFHGAPTGTHTSSIFVALEVGQSGRGIYLGMVKGSGPDMPDQPLMYSPKVGRCFVWPGHYTLLQALAQLPKFTPIRVTRGKDSGKREVRNYTVTSWAPVPEGERALMITAEKAAVDELAKIRAKSSEPPAPKIQAGPGLEAGPDPDDDDLPF